MLSKLLHWILNGVFCRRNGPSKQWAVEAMGPRNIGLSKQWDVETTSFRYFYILYENLVGILGRRSNGLSKLKFEAEFTLSEQRTFIEVPLLRHPDVPTKMWICRNFGMSDSRAVEIALRTPTNHSSYIEVMQYRLYGCNTIDQKSHIDLL